MIKILHASDLHLGWNGNTNYQRLKKMFEEIIANNDVSEYVLVVTGDLIDDEDDDFEFHYIDGTIIKKSVQEVASDLISLFKGKVKDILIVPGNHDYYGSKGNGIKHCEACVKKFNKNIYGSETKEFPVLNIIDNTAFIGLNSAHPKFSATGKIGTKQRNKLKELLNKNEEVKSAKNVVVYLHHHPFKLKKWYQQEGLFDIAYEGAMQLLDSEELLEIIEGKVDLVLFGHRHSWTGKIEKNGTAFINAGSTAGEGCKEGRGFSSIMIADDGEIFGMKRWRYNS